MTDDDYYVILIIITIIGTILLIVFAIYYLYIPAIRASSLFDEIYRRGAEGLDEAQNFQKQTQITNSEVRASIIGLCNLNSDLTPNEKAGLWGTSFDEFCSNIPFGLPETCY